jgi:hypothetical protein
MHRRFAERPDGVLAELRRQFTRLRVLLGRREHQRATSLEPSKFLTDTLTRASSEHDARRKALKYEAS